MFDFVSAIMAGARASVPDLKDATFQSVADADGDTYQIVTFLPGPEPELDTGSRDAGGAALYERMVQFSFYAPRDDFVLKWMKEARTYWIENTLEVDGRQVSEQYPGAEDFAQEQSREPEGSRMYRGLIRVGFSIDTPLR